ncbi:transposase [Arthrobacter sp. CAN_C5]|uniref:transposase n=1 Tax=Arthrobacter sp. CAN_C5 TaxID=2760706 RepID=UPI001AE65411|nr:transposase [Arthrobacter sp. CAN_C5]MBP2215109.1 transposase [Arthrobacter sp. CAN_C5]
MTARSKKKYDATFRDESVRLVLGSDRPVNQVAEDIGVKTSTLGNWVRRYRQVNPETTDRADPRGTVPWDEHQKALAENAKLKAEVEFLGKVSAFFAAKQK